MLPCVVKSRLHSRQGSPRSSCVSPMSTLDSYSGIPIPSGLLTSFSSNIPTFKPANLPTFFDLSPLLPYPCALSCAQQNLISFVFKCFRTLWQKPPGVGVPPFFPRGKGGGTPTPGGFCQRVRKHLKTKEMRFCCAQESAQG